MEIEVRSFISDPADRVDDFQAKAYNGSSVVGVVLSMLIGGIALISNVVSSIIVYQNASSKVSPVAYKLCRVSFARSYTSRYEGAIGDYPLPHQAKPHISKS